jgi:hypothetical protein
MRCGRTNYKIENLEGQIFKGRTYMENDNKINQPIAAADKEEVQSTFGDQLKNISTISISAFKIQVIFLRNFLKDKGYLSYIHYDYPH